MKLMDEAVAPDPSIVAGESAVAGLAGLVAAQQKPDVAKAMQIDEKSVVLLFRHRRRHRSGTLRNTGGPSCRPYSLVGPHL